MTGGSREAFLQRVREAVRTGNRAGTIPDLPARGAMGYQGGGPDPVQRFQEQLQAAGGQCHLVPDQAAAVAKTRELLRALPACRALLGRGAFVDSLGLAEQLRADGVEVFRADELDAAQCRDTLFSADVGISEANALVAETGTVVLRSWPEEPRSFSLLPPVHLVLAERGHLIPDLFDLFEGPSAYGPAELPSCLSLITGPSKTGDIELRLVTGVHGPGEIHVVLVAGGASQ